MSKPRSKSTAKWIATTILCRQCYARVPESEVQNDFLCRACHQEAMIFPAGELNRARRGHKFMPGALLPRIPGLYETEATPLAEKVMYIHYFVAGCDWYVAELDHETGLAFGYADLGMGCPEWGYFDLAELERTVAHELFVIERDLHFTPKKARELGLA
jgi:ribosomal protein L40E